LIPLEELFVFIFPEEYRDLIAPEEVGVLKSLKNSVF
jgi:hypothetical protein